MCGLFAVISSSTVENPSFLSEIHKSRGPDNYNFKFIENSKILLSHSRLSIQDISELANQPFQSECKRYHLIFNGEIYNYKDLKNNYLSDSSFITHSDTELLLKLFIKFGVEKSLHLIDGMYAFVFIDIRTKIIKASRDLFGEKPLFFAKTGNLVCYSSSDEAIAKYINNYKLDSNSILESFYLGQISPTFSRFQKIRRLEPDEIHTINYGVNKIDIKSSKLERKIKKFEFGQYKNNEDFFLKKIKEILIESLSKRLISDRGMALLLSGGIDSSLIALLLSKELNINPNSITTFYKNSNYDETPFAAEVAKISGINNTQILINNEDFTEAFLETRKFPSICTDPAFIPFYIASKNINKFSRVTLTGDGADELFDGYAKQNDYFWNSDFNSKIKSNLLYMKINSARNILSKFIPFFNSNYYKSINQLLVTTLGKNYLSFVASRSLIQPFKKETYKNLLKINRAKNYKFGIPTRFEYDLTNLEASFLVKADNASMAASIEARSPFLNYELLSFSQFVYSKNKNLFKKKRILRNLLQTYTEGTEISNLPKRGYNSPLREIINSKTWNKILIDIKKDKIWCDFIMFNIGLDVNNFFKFKKFFPLEIYRICVLYFATKNYI